MIRNFNKNQIWAKKIFKRFYPHYIDCCTHFNSLLQKEITQDTVLLDIGCGGDTILPSYKGGVKKGVSIDIQPVFVSKDFEFIQADVENLPFRNNSFDVVSARWVLEHLENSEKCIKEISRVMKENASLIILTPNTYNMTMFFSKIVPYKLKKLLLNKLLLRKEQTIFPTYYRLNSPFKLPKILSSYDLKIERFVLVGNPFYFSFSKVLFLFALLVERIINIAQLNFFKAYMIISCKKLSNN